jgi:hypothetical protein
MLVAQETQRKLAIKSGPALPREEKKIRKHWLLLAEMDGVLA